MLPAVWDRISGPRDTDDTGSYDVSRGWRYTIRRNNEERTVDVLVARAHFDMGLLPADAKAAFETRGRSAVDAVLGQDDPPRYLVVTIFGACEDRAS